MILLPERQTLSDWLRIATWRLADSAKERIRIEIEAHYTQSVEAHRENGLSESAAHAAALVELGDPEAAAKHFRKRHLTELDTDRLEKSARSARSIWNLLGAYFVFYLFTTGALPFRPIMLEHYHPLPLYLATAFLVMLALPTACFLVARYSSVRPNRPLLLICLLSNFAWLPFLFSYFITIEPTFVKAHLIDNCFFAILFCAVPIGRLIIYLRLWMKLSKTSPTNLSQAL